MAKLKYDASFPEKVEAHAGNGDTDSRIARRLGISPASFYNYKKQFPEFAEALERGRRQCYGRMRKQLLSMALGECAVRTETYRDGDLYKTTLRQLPPNLPAIKYWLAQRDSKLSGMDGNRESASAQRDSKLSGMGLEASEVYGANGTYGPNTDKTVSAQRDSKLSGMDGCHFDFAKLHKSHKSHKSRKSRRR